MEDFLKYNFTGGQIYEEGGFVKRVENCNGFIATNIGTCIVTINDHVLYPGVPGTSNGDSITVGGNRGEVLLGNIKIVFTGGGTRRVTIDQKYYSLDGKVVR